MITEFLIVMIKICTSCFELPFHVKTVSLNGRLQPTQPKILYIQHNENKEQ